MLKLKILPRRHSKYRPFLFATVHKPSKPENVRSLSHQPLSVTCHFYNRSHEARLSKLQTNIVHAKESIARSGEDFREAESEREEVRSKATILQQEIESIRRQLAHL